MLYIFHGYKYPYTSCVKSGWPPFPLHCSCFVFCLYVSFLISMSDYTLVYKQGRRYSEREPPTPRVQRPIAFWVDFVFTVTYKPMQIFQPLLLLIYNFPVLCIYINIGAIHGNIMPCRNSHYGHFGNIGHYCLGLNNLEYGQDWCLFKW